MREKDEERWTQRKRGQDPLNWGGGSEAGDGDMWLFTAVRGSVSPCRSHLTAREGANEKNAVCELARALGCAAPGHSRQDGGQGIIRPRLEVSGSDECEACR